MTAQLKRGDIVAVDLRGAEGGEKMGVRPCIVVQNDIGNRYSPLTIIVPLTDARQDKRLPVQVALSAAELGFEGSKDSVVEGGHIRTIDKRRISRHLGRVDAATLGRIEEALRVSLGL